MNTHIKMIRNHQYSFSNNDVFRHLLQLTKLDADIPTLIQLFNEQGIEICENRIRIWSAPIQQIGRPIPEIIFKAFMNLLAAINAEAMEKEVNLFDLSGILQDLRK